MRKIISGMAVLLMLLYITTSAYAATQKVGAVIGYTLYTDIVTYINGSPIDSYNINGYTAVAVEDLADYGFSVAWNPETRALDFCVDGSETKTSYSPPKINKNMVGKRKSSVLFTDIKTFWNINTQIDTYNIGGITIIYVDDLAKLCGESYTWKATERRLELKVVKPWSVSIENPEYEPSAPLDNPCSYTFKKLENESFIIASSSGNVSSIDKFELWCGCVRFSLSQNNTGSLNVTGGIDNIVYGERIAENTPERFAQLAASFRVYINDMLIAGELSRWQGTGHVDFEFYFNELQSLNKIETIRVEIGPSK